MSGFWQYSLKFYSDPEVQAACLRLQDEGSADVNLVLYMLFHAAQGHCLSRVDIARVDAAVAEWRLQVVQKLRHVRRHLKPLEKSSGDPDVAALRRRVKVDELEAERIQQSMIEELGKTLDAAPSSPIKAFEANVEAYATQLSHSLPEEAVAVLRKRFQALL